MNAMTLQNDLLSSIKSGSISLTHLVQVDSISKVPAYQIETIRSWLDKEVKNYRPCDGKNDAGKKEWYINRENTFIGPISLGDASDLSRQNLIFPTDLIINPVEAASIAQTDLKNINPSLQTKPDFYTNRRAVRVPLECWTKISGKDFQSAAQCLEISSSGLSLYMKSPAPADESLAIEIDSPEHGLKITPRAQLRSAVPVLDGYRCGFAFTDLSKDETKLLAQYLKSNASNRG